MTLYLCVMENTKNNNIHQNQILPLVNNKDSELLFIAPLFILNKKGFSINNQKYLEKNVHHVRIPFLSYSFSMIPLLIPFLLICCLPILIYFVLKYKIKTIHARNHLSALCSIIINFFLKNVKVLFDIRGLYSEEGVILRRWKYNSLNFKVWKFIEKKICLKSDIVTTISNNMTNYISLNYNTDKEFYIPAIVDTKKFFFSKELRENFRKEYSISDTEVVFLYVGSISLWHDIQSFYSYIEYYIHKYSILHYRVFILSNINRNDCSELHDKYDSVIMLVKPEEVNKFLCGSDIGVLPGTSKSGPAYDLLYKTMISSKVEEYLCTGLKILVNDRIEEVNDLIKNDYIDKDDVFYTNHEREILSQKYKNIFSSENIRIKYNQLYKRISRD